MLSFARTTLLFAVTVAVAFASLVALAAFSTAVSAHQNDDADGEHTHVAGEQTDATAAEEDTVTTENHAWENYHWARKANPFSVKLGNDVSLAWKPYLQAASSSWSKSDVLDTSIVTGKTSPKTCKPTAGRVEVCNAKYGSTGWLGLAQIWLSGGHITKGTAKLNDTYYSTAKYNTPAWRSHVMCQEVGHTFGLGHQDTSGADLHTCMDYANNPDGDNMIPNDHDYEQLRAIYDPTFTSTKTATKMGHLDATNTSQTSATGTSRGHFNSKAAWGRLKHASPDGRHKVYEREFSDGTTMVTFVEGVELEDQPKKDRSQKAKQDQ